MIEEVIHREELLFIGFDEGTIEVWNMLSPKNAKKMEEKEVVFIYK
jgi:hypothetical protein